MVDICSRYLSLKGMVGDGCFSINQISRIKQKRTSTFLVNKRFYLVRAFCIFMIVIQLFQLFSTY